MQIRKIRVYSLFFHNLNSFTIASSLFEEGFALIIFTVTNTVSSQIYVGYTRNNLQEQWQKIVNAAEENLDFPLYKEIRTHGVDSFIVDEYDFAETREEVKDIEDEVIRLHNAKSLRGYKTSNFIIAKKNTQARITQKRR